MSECILVHLILVNKEFLKCSENSIKYYTFISVTYIIGACWIQVLTFNYILKWKFYCFPFIKKYLENFKKLKSLHF